MLDELDIGVEHAEAIVEKGIKLGVHSDGVMPDTKKGKIEAAHNIITLAIDSFVEDGVRPDAKGEDDEETENIRSTAKDILELFELAGIKAVKKGKKYTGDIKFEEPPELEEAEDDEEEEDDSVGDETPFDVEDVIKGYWELTAATRIKKIKALKLDLDDDEDYNTLVGIAEAEENADKPSSRVLAYVEELIPAEVVEEDEDDEEEVDEVEEDEDDEGEEDEEEEDEDEDDEDTGDGEEGEYTEEELEELDKDELKEVWDELDLDEDDFPKRFTDKGKARVIEAILKAQGGGEEEEEESEEPWDGYDDSKEAAIKAVLEEQLEDEDEPLEAEQVEFVIEYENANKGRARLVKWLTAFLEDNFGEEVDEEDEDDEEEVVEEKSAKKGKGKSANANVAGLVITRAQILEALENGEVTIG